MPSEARRGALRIATNYCRLGVTVVLGLALVPMMIHGVGKEAYGLYALLGSTIGFAQMFRDIARSSMNRELGAAYHGGDVDHFKAIFNSAMVISMGLAGIAALVFLVLYFAIPVLNIPANLHGAARWVLISGGVNTVFVVGLEAMQNMYMVTERFVSYNLRTTLERAGYTVVAFALFIWPWQIHDQALGLVLFACISNGVSLFILLNMVARILRLEPSLRPDFSRVSRKAVRSVIGTGSWNILTVTAMNLHIRLDQLLVNIFFGVSGNAAFALAVTLTSYIRMLTVGVTDGLDAVSARVSTTTKNSSAVRELVHHTTRMTAFVALPAGLLVLILAHPLMDLWVARRSQKAVVLIPLAVVAVQILMVGMTSRAITDNWTRILYGAGFVSRYARQILIGALFNPIVAIALIYLLPGPFTPKDAMPEPYKFYGPAIAFAAVFTAVHLFFLPSIGAKCLNIRYRDMFLPILPSFAVAVCCAPILVGASMWITQWNIFWLAAVGGAYGAIYFLISMFVVVTRDERQRIVRMIQRALNRRRPPGPDAPGPQAESTDPIRGAAEDVE